MTKTSPIRPAAASNSALPELYRTMRRIRTFEERVGELFVRGQSAGSMSISNLQASPLSRTLFHKAVGMAGSTK